jgi:hypothetical protein
MRFFLDTEFNGFGGKLISLALVPENSSKPEFYKELEMKDQLDPWVKEHVVPHLFQKPVTRSEFQLALGEYLWNCREEIIIIADWPDDIRYFCESLITGPGMCLGLLPNIKFELDFGIEYESEVPHNALYDARAISEFYMKRESKYGS